MGSEVKIKFDAPPAVGTIMTWGGQPYEVVRLEPYVRRDGVGTTLIVWRTHCSDCKEAFEHKTSLTVRNVNRRCGEHRKPMRPVGRHGRRAITPKLVKAKGADHA